MTWGLTWILLDSSRTFSKTPSLWPSALLFGDLEMLIQRASHRQGWGLTGRKHAVGVLSTSPSPPPLQAYLILQQSMSVLPLMCYHTSGLLLCPFDQGPRQTISLFPPIPPVRTPDGSPVALRCFPCSPSWEDQSYPSLPSVHHFSPSMHTQSCIIWETWFIRKRRVLVGANLGLNSGSHFQPCILGHILLPLKTSVSLFVQWDYKTPMGCTCWGAVIPVQVKRGYQWTLVTYKLLPTILSAWSADPTHFLCQLSTMPGGSYHFTERPCTYSTCPEKKKRQYFLYAHRGKRILDS